MKPVLLVTMGDPNGVGPEILLKSAAINTARSDSQLGVVGDYSYLARLAPRFSKRKIRLTPIHATSFSRDLKFSKNELPVIDLNNLRGKKPRFGKPCAWAGHASGEYIHAAVNLVRDKLADGIVTLPINKEAFYLGGWGKRFPGHTEMIAQLSRAEVVRLMLVSGPVRSVYVTQHIPLRRIFSRINPTSVRQTIEVTNAALQKIGFREPKIALCGLNPHAGDGGVLGLEEKEILIPAAVACRKKGIHVSNPISADVVWPLVAGKKFDVGVAMYHDQGQIPVKFAAHLPGGKPTVNVTLGLDFVRTSVGHGTAYDISGQGVASDKSFLAATDLAIQMLEN